MDSVSLKSCTTFGLNLIKVIHHMFQVQRGPVRLQPGHHVRLLRSEADGPLQRGHDLVVLCRPGEGGLCRSQLGGGEGCQVRGGAHLGRASKDRGGSRSQLWKSSLGRGACQAEFPQQEDLLWRSSHIRGVGHNRRSLRLLHCDLSYEGDLLLHPLHSKDLFCFRSVWESGT